MSSDNDKSAADNAETSDIMPQEEYVHDPKPAGGSQKQQAESVKKDTGPSGPDAGQEKSSSARQHTPQFLDEIDRRRGRGGSGRRQSRWPVFLLFLLLCGVSAAGAWFGYQQWMTQQSQAQTIAQLRDELSQNASQLEQQMSAARDELMAGVESELAGLAARESELQEVLAEVEAAGTRDDQRFARLQQQVGRDMQDVSDLVSALQTQMATMQQRDARWLNAEAAYLMRLAQRKLTLEADISSTVMLLNSIDSLLSQQDSLLANTARQNIQQDIERLESLRLPNRVALAEQLSALSDQLRVVSFASSRQDAYVESLQDRWQQGAGSGEGQEATWWQATLDLLRTVFVWREVDRSEPAFLQPDQEQLLKQQMLLQIEQARLAVVQADQAMFQLALEQLASIINEYMNDESGQTRSLLSEIQRLHDVRITAELPSLDGSADLIRQLGASASGRVE